MDKVALGEGLFYLKELQVKKKGPMLPQLIQIYSSYRTFPNRIFQDVSFLFH